MDQSKVANVPSRQDCGDDTGLGEVTEGHDCYNIDLCNSGWLPGWNLEHRGGFRSLFTFR